MFSASNRRSDWYRRPETLQTSSHREDQQPNEAIAKRHLDAPPTILSTSVPKPHNYYGRGMETSRRGRGHNSRGKWTQVAKRGKKRGQGGYGVGRGGGRHGGSTTQSSSTFNHPGRSAGPSFPLEQAQPPFMTKSPATKRSASPSGSEDLPSLTNTIEASTGQCKPHEIGHMKLNPSLPTKQGSREILIPALPTPDPPLHTPPTPPRLLTPSKSPTPPLKRRKVDHAQDLHSLVKMEEAESQEGPPAALSLPAPPIKHEERTPTPPLPDRRLVTESCSFYPLPTNCHKSNPDYKQNRHALFSREYSLLKSHGLKKTKVLFREDGMVIEWTSSTPVWSDTLRPEPSNLSLIIEAASKANSRSSASRRKSTTPRRSASHSIDQPLSNDVDILPSFVNPPSSQRETLSQKSKSSLIPPLPRRKPLPLPITNPKSVVDPNTNPPTDTPIEPTNFKPEADPPPDFSGPSQVSPPLRRDIPRRAWAADELAEIEPLAISYLQRYIREFDMDRSHLQGGYVDDAILSVRMSRSTEAARAAGTLYQSDSRFVQGPRPISDTLASLGPQKFCSSGIPGRVMYDVVLLNSEAGGGILLTVYGEVASELSEMNPHLHQITPDIFTITQSFILQRNRETETAELWPLQATSHQIVLKQISGVGPGLLSMVEATSLEEEFPWLP
ncbi:hypothetical protein BDZ94DRAFT_1325477 [Collybia nuda]|uniref:NTF2 domain-containing protein n=1 Tax=Collybia nuda TaxID=64659 RepID=A0A9P5XZC1_9AGAR|nr:hypothetical protein BDZ94DRAFT_1325477 [Collybia nuda]